MKQSLYRKKKKGFSLLEVVIALSLLGAGLLSVITLYVRSLDSIFALRAQIAAIPLAQEGVELARNIADSDGDLDNLQPGDNKKIEAKFNTGDIDLTDSASFNLYYKDGLDQEQFTHNSGHDSTRFARRIVITQGNFDGVGTENDDRRVVSLVTWDNSTPPTNTSECTSGKSCVFAVLELFGSNY